MIITSIRLRAGEFVNERDITITFPLKEVATNEPYICVASTGLGPPDNILSKPINYYSGDFPPVEVLPEKRDVVLRIGLNPDITDGQSFSSLRDAVYRLIASDIKGVVTFELLNEDELVAYAEGRFIRVEATHFTEQPELQISLEFDDPLFYAPEYIEIDDFSSDELVINYEGTAPTGFVMNGTFDANKAEIAIRNVDPPTWGFVIIYAFLDDDFFELGTHRQDHYFVHFRPTMGPPTITVMTGLVSAGSIWPQLYPGENKIDMYNSEAEISVDKITYRNAYWGV